MRRLISAIAAALRSTVSFIWERCRETGSWTLRAVASIGGGGSAPAVDTSLQDLEAAMAADIAQPSVADVVVPPAVGGDGYDRIQRACRDINMREQPAREDWEALSNLQRDWLQELTPSMRLVVGNIEKAALVEHMRGGKGLRGVIRCDQASIDGWRYAIAIEQAEEEDAAPQLAM